MTDFIDVPSSGDNNGYEYQNPATITALSAGTYSQIIVNASGQIVSASTPVSTTAGTFNHVVIDDFGRVVSGTLTPYLTANQNINVTGDVIGVGSTLISTSLAAVGNAGTYTKVTTDSKGRVVSGTALNINDVVDALGFAPAAPIVVATPGTFSAMGVNDQGQVINGVNLVVTGDATGTAAGASVALTLAASGVTAGTYTKVVTNAKGLLTSGGALASSDVTTALGYTPLNVAGGTIAGSLVATAINSTPIGVTTPSTGAFTTLSATTSATAPTAAVGTNTTQLATTAFTTAAVAVETARAEAAEALKAPSASPTLSGTINIPSGSTINAAGNIMPINSGMMGMSGHPSAAAGTTFATATQLSDQFAMITSGTGGVILPATIQVMYYVCNITGAPVTVYNPAGNVIGTVPYGNIQSWYCQSTGANGYWANTAGVYTSLTTTSLAATTGTFTTIAAGNVSATTSQATSTATVARSLAARATEIFNVLDFGADPTGVANSATAFIACNAAIVANGGGTFYMPSGNYLYTPAVGQALYLHPNTTVRGAGKTSTNINFFSTVTGATSALFAAMNLTGNAYLNFEGFTVTGPVNWTGQNSAHAIYVTGADYASQYVRVINCDFFWINQSAVRCLQIYNVLIDGCSVCYADGGFDTWDCSAVIITNNHLRFITDDSTAWHSDDTVAGPVRGSVIITNNIYEDCQGISAGGPKQCIIEGNIFRRCLNYCICFFFGGSVGEADDQGNTMAFGVSIKNNQMYDCWLPGTITRQQGQYYIIVSVANQSVGSGAGLLPSAPGTPSAANGITPLYGADGIGNFYLNEVAFEVNPTYTSPCAGSYWIDISNNIISRTLPAVAAWSDWGYGTDMYSQNDALSPVVLQPFNPPVTDSNLNTPGILFNGSFRGCRVTNNIIDTSGPAIAFAHNINNMEYDDFVVSDNTLRNAYGVPQNNAGFWNPYTFTQIGLQYAASGAVIQWLGTTPSYQRIVFRNNQIDGDPLALSTGRATNGEWTEAFSTTSTSAAMGVAGIYAPYLEGAVYIGNHFRNVNVPVVDPTAVSVTGMAYYKNNVTYGDYAALGFSTANQGIGTVPKPGEGWTPIWEQSNLLPGNGSILFAPFGEAASVPGTGTYWLPGQIVKNTAANGSWLRATVSNSTGSNNVLGTDWIASTASITSSPGTFNTLVINTAGQVVSGTNTSYLPSSGGTLTGALTATTGTSVFGAVSATSLVSSGTIGGLVLATGSSAALSLANSVELYPENFGAAGNGVTDDTAAINAYITHIKSSLSAVSTTHLTFQFKPNSAYLISGPLNFGFVPATGGNQKFTINGNGATITGTTLGPALLDCINFDYGSSIQNINIIGLQSGSQQVGILYGYSNLAVAGGWSDSFIMMNVNISGYFAFAAEINRGADTSQAYGCNLSALNTTGTGVAIGSAGNAFIGDAQGLWNVVSNITTIVASTGSNPIQIRKNNCTFQCAAGSPIYVDSNVSLDMLGCYANTRNSASPQPNVIQYILQTGVAGPRDFSIDCHFESSGCVSSTFYFYAPWATSSSPASTTFNKFFYKNFIDNAVTSTFGASAYVEVVRFGEADWSFGSGSSSTPVFDVPSTYVVNGTLKGISSTNWNAPNTFNGLFYGSSAIGTYTFGHGNALFWEESSGSNFGFVGTTAITLPTLQGTVSTSGYINLSNGAAAAAGTTFATATALTHQYSAILSGTGGVILPSGFGCIYYVWNNTSAAITVYAPSDAPLGTIAAGATSKWFAYNSTTYNPS